MRTLPWPALVSSARFAVIASGCASCPRLVCRREGCGAEFCYHCKQPWHPNQTCDSARQQRALSLRTHSNHSPSYAAEQGPSESISSPSSFSLSSDIFLNRLYRMTTPKLFLNQALHLLSFENFISSITLSMLYFTVSVYEIIYSLLTEAIVFTVENKFSAPDPILTFFFF